MDELAKYIAWVKYEQRELKSNLCAEWQRQRECTIARMQVGDPSNGVLGSLFCLECEDRLNPGQCDQEADESREGEWLTWAACKVKKQEEAAKHDAPIARRRQRWEPITHEGYYQPSLTKDGNAWKGRWPEDEEVEPYLTAEDLLRELEEADGDE